VNEDRRKRLTAIAEALSSLSVDATDIEGEIDAIIDYANEHWADVLTLLSKLRAKARELYTLVEAIKDEEQEALEGLPESLQSSDKADTMSAAVDSLDSALRSLDDIVSLDLDEFIEVPNIDTSSLSEALTNLEEARDG
jgi:hypothetical protein